jgi:hypothetical protein
LREQTPVTDDSGMIRISPDGGQNQKNPGKRTGRKREKEKRKKKREEKEKERRERREGEKKRREKK